VASGHNAPIESPEFAVQATAASAAVAVCEAGTVGPVAGAVSVAAAPSEAAPSSPAVVIPTDVELDTVQLDAVKLHVYQVALELHTLCSTLVASLNRIVRDQLERASLSVVLNVAEAGGRHSRRDKARYYTIARGSATEVAALMDVLERRHLAPLSAIRNGRRLSIRVVQMLTRMNQKLLP
jgi:four helix bundle protein